MISSESLPDLGQPTAEQATAWVAAALAEAKALQKYDQRRYPASSDPKELANAKAVHAHWADWVERTLRLVSLTAPLVESGKKVWWREQLLDESARARAFLQVTPESHLRAMDQVRRGETIDGRLVRDEVRARRRAMDAAAAAGTKALAAEGVGA